MAEISAKDVMALRAATGLGMMDCKQALQETSGDVEAAEEFLRKKLKGKMDARTDRAAGEGRIAIATSDDGSSAAIVELRAETDFTAKNEKFLEAADKAAKLALEKSAGAVDADDAITGLIDQIRIVTGENASYARGHKLTGGSGGTFGVYVHHDGKTGVLLQGEGDLPEALLRDICMHITAITPRPHGVTADDIPANIVEKERKFALEQAMESGKPQEIAEKMVEGKMRKFFEEVALMEQPFIKDPEKKIKDLLPKGASIVAFLRWQVGEAS
ncbi:MAG: translation elongation factor Ts [Phycisphaeraceae bacterium]|nr:MAG: translation elongation factor Ts [Phycisphaeraceae bacterium]